MRKNFQRQPHLPFLPAIPTTSSRQDVRLLRAKPHKENQYVQQNIAPKFKMEPAHHCLAKPNNQRIPSSPFEELLNKKLLDMDRGDIPTQPKRSRPWVAKELQMNKLATRTSRLQPIQQKDGENSILRRKSCHYNSSPSRQSSFRESTIEKTTRLPRTIGKRCCSLPRDKINSCKIAIKKRAFPMDQKKFEHQKMVQFFDQDDTLSTIVVQDQSQGQFISFDSYRQIDF